ncbi:MAG: cation transporter [Gammaproteobacteria bacterium]|jgi:Co/Zn/Cd efflux system component|nr:cation transporter [Gammaproteobacteria bacterium]
MSDCGCGNTIETATLERRQRRVLAAVLAINLATFVMMLAASVLSGSSALLSGTLDNLGDALTYALSFAVVGAAAGAKAKVALFKGLLITAAALAVAGQIVWSLFHPGVPVVETMSVAAVLNLGANAICLALLTPLRNDDVNMASVWECSRNDIFDGVAVIVAAGAVWLLDSGWPDLLIAAGLVVVFLRSALRVVRNALEELGHLQAHPSA